MNNLSPWRRANLAAVKGVSAILVSVLTAIAAQVGPQPLEAMVCRLKRNKKSVCKILVIMDRVRNSTPFWIVLKIINHRRAFWRKFLVESRPVRPVSSRGSDWRHGTRPHVTTHSVTFAAENTYSFFDNILAFPSNTNIAINRSWITQETRTPIKTKIKD